MSEHIPSEIRDYTHFFKVEDFRIGQNESPLSGYEENSVQVTGYSRSDESVFSITFSRGFEPPGETPRTYREFETNTLYLEEIVVKPEYEGRGIATTLLGCLADASRKEGCSAIRANFTAPAMVNAAERLASEGAFGSPRYCILGDAEWSPELSTSEILQGSPNTSTADESIRAINATQRGVVCVIPL